MLTYEEVCLPFSICSTDTLYTLSFRKLNNIFIVPKQSRAQSATELLQELNNDVSGNFVEEVCLKLFYRFFFSFILWRLWNDNCVVFVVMQFK